MNVRTYFRKTLNFEPVGDRLPIIEWAAWWDETIERWEGEGLPANMPWEDSLHYFGLDPLYNIAAYTLGSGVPQPKHHGAAIITDQAAYEQILPSLYPQSGIEFLIDTAASLKEKHDRGDISIRLWLDGFFWFPRTLLGIEGHLYAFYDQPELIHQINEDLVDFHRRTVNALLGVLEPDMIGIAEDMSYNHGPMLSRQCFNEFLLPYYQKIVPLAKSYGIPVLVDSDGQIEEMIPWLQQAGIDGAYPLERQAGVDVVRIREQYPQFLMMGGYDKMVMSQGEDAMRMEFERLLPIMRSGGYILSVDHQTPPGVSLDQYKTFARLLSEYAREGAST